MSVDLAAQEPKGRDLIGREHHHYYRRGAIDTRAVCLYCHQRIADGREVHVQAMESDRAADGYSHTVCWLMNAGK